MKNKKKNKYNKKRFSWNIWLTIASIFLGVGVVTGAVIGGVYLNGGFEEKLIAPETINLNYNDDLIASNSKLEVEDDFQLTITSDTKNITENKVKLFFANGVHVDRENVNGVWYVSDPVIRVPEIVTIGQPFTVHLLEEKLKDESGQEIIDLATNTSIDWIVGGISNLYAKSNYEKSTAPIINVTIAVDVPVYQTEMVVINSNGVETNQIVTNETFSLKTNFIPVKSQYMYSDATRLKHAYYEAVSTDKIQPIYDDLHNMHFLANDTMSTNDIVINSYIFKNSSDQVNAEQALADVTSPNSYHQLMLEILAGSSSSINSQGTISIGEASIGNFMVAKQGQTIEMITNESLRLYMNEYLYQSASDFLGVNVYSTTNGTNEDAQILDNLLPKIAINFQIGGKDAGHGLNKVVSVNGGDEEGRYVDIDGMRYYKPNANGINPRYSYWDLSSIAEAVVEMRVVLLVDENTSIFQDEEGDLVYTVYLDIAKHHEKDLSWTDDSDLNVMLDYDKDGRIIPYTLNLNELVSIPEGNIYKDYAFFASFGGDDLSQCISKADKVFGRDAYEINQSGLYSTNGGELLLIAIRRNSINLYDSASFRLYYATIKTDNGQPVLDADDKFQIALMSSGNKRIVCEKALYTDSIDVEQTVINTENFPLNDKTNEVDIPQGTEKTFSVTFTIKQDALSVFNQEFNQNRIRPSITDAKANELVGTYLGADGGTLTVDGASGEGKLQYNFTLKTNVEIEADSGIYFDTLSLKYSTGAKNISWDTKLVTVGEGAQIICIYTPTAKEIQCNITEENLSYIQNQITVSQNLSNSGEFNINISLTNGSETMPFDNLEEFIDFLAGRNDDNFVVIDQKYSTDTISNQWKYVVVKDEDNAISISEADTFKSFTFKDTKQNQSVVELNIQSYDEKATATYQNGEPIVIKMEITSKGITSINVDQSLNTYVVTKAETNSTITSSAVVSKYGAKGNLSEDAVILNNCITFYVTEEGNVEVPYTGTVKYKFNPQYLVEGALSVDHIIDLFGENGMLTLYENDSTQITYGMSISHDASAKQREEYANKIRSTLIEKDIYKILINKNFAIEQTLYFIAYDENEAINTSLELNLLKNIEVSSVSYPTTGTLYAGYCTGEDPETCGVELINQVINKNADSTEAFNSYYSGTHYIIQNQDTQQYELSTNNQNSIGKYENGRVVFEDFWDEETKDFAVFFRPEGDNAFAINHVINFKVTRDLAITKGKVDKFYVLGTDQVDVSNFVSVGRYNTSNENSAFTNEIEYAFSNDYLTLNGTNIEKNSSSKFLFDYNQKSISTTLYVKLVGAENKDALASIDINIELFNYKEVEPLKNYDSIYQAISSTIWNKDPEYSGYKTQSQIVGDVEYVMFESPLPYWQFNDLGSYQIRPVNTDFNGNKLRSIYQVGTGYKIQFQSETKKEFYYGLNDQTKYIALKFYSGATELPVMLHLPIIISNIGFNTVVYDNNQHPESTLALSMYTPQQLLEMGVYNEIQAGKVFRILSQINLGEKATKGGLYQPQGTIVDIQEYLLEGYENDVINSINLLGGSLSLNHLASQETYIAFTYVLTKDGKNMTLYYLLKVIPDVIVEKPLYEFDGDTKYITAEDSPIDLEETFATTTLHSGEKRFNISKNINLALATQIKVKVTEDLEVIIDYSANTKTLNLLASESVDGFQYIDLKDYFTDLVLGNKFNITVNTETEIYYNNEKLATFNDVELVIASQLVVKISQDTKLRLSYIDDQSIERILKLDDGEYHTISFNDFTGLATNQQLQVLIVNGNAEIYYNDELVFSNPAIKNEIVSVRVGDDEPLSGEDWKSVLEVTFSSDYRFMTFKALTNEMLTITLKHTYIEGENSLSVVGCEQFYTFVLNDTTTNYSVRFTDKNTAVGESQETDQYVYEVENSKDITEYEFTIDLLKNEQAGGSLNQTVVYNKLSISIASDGGRENLYENKLEGGVEDTRDEETKAIDENGFYYNKSNGKFVFKTKDYIDSDKEVRFTIYIEQGHLATMIVKLKSNATYTALKTQLNAGATHAFAEIAKIKIGEVEKYVDTDFAVTTVKITGDNGFVSWDADSNSLEVADLIADKKVTINYTITFNEASGLEGKEFKFSQEYILKANITPKTAFASDTVTIAGNSHIVTFENLYTGTLKNATISISASSSNTAFKGIEGNLIYTNFVSEKVTLELEMKVTLSYTNNNGVTTKQDYDLNYTFAVVPSVMLTANYPKPNDTTNMTFEYLDNNQTFENIVTFINSKPIFGDASRIVVSGCSLDKEGVKYNNGVIVKCISDMYEISISDAKINVEFCDCNAFVSLTTKHSAEIISKSTEFDELSTLFTTFIGEIGIPEDKMLKIEGENKNYTAFFNKAQSFIPSTQDLSKSAIIGLNSEYSIVFGDTDNPLYATLQNVVSRLFGFNDKSEFETHAQNLASALTENNEGASINSVEERIKYDGAIYTENGSFILPYAFANQVAKTIYAYVIVDSSGSMSIWISDLESAFKASNVQHDTFNSEINQEETNIQVYGRCTLFGQPDIIKAQTLEYKYLEVIVLEKDNAILEVGGEAIVENQLIDLGEQIKFSRGGASGEATIKFRVKYQEVSKDYLVKILDNSLTVSLNAVTNNLVTDGTGAYEKIYVDKTSTENLFAEDRLLYVEMKDASDFEDEYYLIFKGEDNYFYSSRAIYFNATDRNQKMYVDLGLSMAGKTYVGAYKTSEVEALKLDVTAGSPIKLNKKELTEIPDKLIDYTSNIFLSENGETPNIQLASRVQMIYGQLDGEDIYVDYDKYSSIIGSLSFATTLDKVESVANILPNTFSRDDGSATTHEFTLTYRYMPVLDIKVENVASFSKNYIQVEVNKEYDSIVSLFGIKHISTDKNISQSLFMSEGDGLTFKFIQYSKNGSTVDINWQGIVNDYLDNFGISSFETCYNNDENNNYIYTSAKRNGSGCVHDYSMIPFGAKNQGDYLLGELIYKTGAFSNTFYVVIKVIPDYVVSYGGSTDFAEDEANGEIISNLNNIYKIAETVRDEESNVYYRDFTLAGENGYLSIKHNNNSENLELSVSNFSITMEENCIVDSQEYNVPTNISGKLIKDSSNANCWASPTASSTKYTLKDTNTSIKFTKVPEIIFGDQYYMIEGEDNYGYKFRIYFLLQATRQNPETNNSIEIAEGGYFDIGVAYQLLSISEETDTQSGNKYYHINIPEQEVIPEANDKYPLVVLKGIEAWMFDREYTEYLTAVENVGGYKAKEGIEFTVNEAKYLAMPELGYISVTAVNFYKDGEKVLEATATLGEGEDKSWSSFATSKDVFFNGLTLRDSYTDTNPDGATKESLWKLGKIEKTDLFAGSNLVELTMLITLKYSKGGVTEYYNCPVNTTIRRDLTITEVEDAKYQRDGQEFSVADQFTVNDAAGNSITDATYLNDTLEVLVPAYSKVSFKLTLTRESEKKKTILHEISNESLSYAKTTYLSLSELFDMNVHLYDNIAISDIDNSKAEFYYNYSCNPSFVTTTEDQFAIDLPENSEVSFTLTLERDGKKLYVKSHSISNESENSSTEYLSLSDIFEEEIKTDDKIFISNISNPSVSFKYDNNYINTDMNFTISEIKKDTIYIESANLISNNPSYNVRKYYILTTKFNNTKGTTYHYRTSRNYVVSGVAHTVTKNYTGPIGFVIGNETDLNGQKQFEFSEWGPAAFKIYSDASMKQIDLTKNFDSISKYIVFSLSYDDDDSLLGNAEITKNGTITLGDDFTPDQYIKVVVKMVVSGDDRNINSNDDNNMTYITLGVFNLSTKVRRNLIITEKEETKYQRDGQEFSVADQFVVNDAAGNPITDAKYLNDTLEVLVPADSKVSFNLTLTRGEEEEKTISHEISNESLSYAKTAYLSLSELFGMNVHLGDSVSITLTKENASFYYSDSKIESGNSFIISEINKDKIYIESADLISSSPSYNVRKYYILTTKFNNTEGTTYHYRISRDYVVSGVAYSITQKYTEPIGFVIGNGTETTLANSEFTFSEWGPKAFTLYKKDASAETEIDFASISNYIKFSLSYDDADSLLGNAEITDDGKITLGADFTPDQYIKINVKMAVSGDDRDIDTTDDSNYISLGFLFLSTTVRNLPTT